MAAFTQRQATPKKSSNARGSIVRKFESSDEDDSSDLSDSDEEQSWKRRRSNKVPSISHRMPAPNTTTMYERQNSEFNRGDSGPKRDNVRHGGSGAKRRKNNIWGSVALEQNQEALEREITNFGVRSVSERNVESYSLTESQQIPLGAVPDQPTDGSIPKGRRLMKAVGETEDDAWLADYSPESPHQESDEERAMKQPKDDLREKLQQRGSMMADRFRRTNVKNRLGSRSDNTFQAIAMKSIEIDPSAEPKVIAGQLAYSLQEPKRHLVLRIVKILGVQKSLEIWKKTEEIENDGGMMIMNRSRRRSPGGVFIQLMKTDPDISPEMIKEIFAEEKKQCETDKKKKRKRIRKFAAKNDDHGNTEQEQMEDGGEDGMEEEDGDMDLKSEPSVDEQNSPPFMAEGNFQPDEQQTMEEMEGGLPLPQKECADIKETDVILFPQQENAPKRNENSEPEDGEVLDDDCDEEG